MKQEFDEEDLEEITFDEIDGEDEPVAEEEEERNPWVMAAIFGGLIVMAAIICAVLWHFTHLDNHNDTLADSKLSTESTENILAPEQSDGIPEPDTDENVMAGGDSDAAASGQDFADEGNEQADSGSMDGQEQGSGQEGSELPEQSAQPQEPVSGTTSMEFAEANDEVTAKDVTNLRSAPSTTDSENVVAQLKNGDKLSRTGTNSATGWSRLVYNGETVYAVTQYLTTDLNYKAPVAAANPNRITTQDGRVIIFTDCSDNITPKEYVNLRTEPSTSQGDATVRCQVNSGETVLRTGYSADSGWSRVEYNGEVLYVVSSLMKAAQ